MKGMKKVPSYRHLQEARLIYSRTDKGNPKTEIEAYVGGINFKVGITLKALDIEAFNKINVKYGYELEEDGELLCLNRGDYELVDGMEFYTKKFIYIVHCIEAGCYDRERKTKKFNESGSGAMSVCAFL